MPKMVAAVISLDVPAYMSSQQEGPPQESPPQEGPRLTIDSDNKAALIVIVTAIGLSWTLLTLIIRVVSKLHISRSIGLEEYLVIAASIAAGVSSACVLVGIKYGLGQRIEQVNSNDNEFVLKLLFISDIFYPITLSIAKAATLPLLIKLTRIRKFIVACYVLAIFTTLWGVLSVVVVAARCHLEDPWTDLSAKRCPSLYDRWVAIEIGSLLIEVLIFLVFLSIVRILKMRRAMKLKLMFAFATRLTVIIPIIFRLVYLRRELPVENDTTFALTNSMIATQVVLHYTTMASSFAYLKPFLRAFDSNLGATVKVDTVVSSGYTPTKWNEHGGTRNKEGQSPGNKSYAMQRLKRSDISRAGTQHDHIPISKPVHEQLTLSPSTSDRLERKTTILDSRDQQRTQRNRYTSREPILPIITKTQEWRVFTESRDPGDARV